MDYQEKFAIVVKDTTFRLMFALTPVIKWTCYYMDIKIAFLNSNLEEEVYIHPLEGLFTSGKILKLKKAIYGLYQAPRAWYRTFKDILEKNGWVTL